MEGLFWIFTAKESIMDMAFGPHSKILSKIKSLILSIATPKH